MSSIFVCPCHPEFTFHSFAAFANCRGCSGPDTPEFAFNCELVQTFA